MTTWFPNPAEQAIHLLSACKDDLAAAQTVARYNATKAQLENNAGSWFWRTVRDLLIPERTAKC